MYTYICSIYTCFHTHAPIEPLTLNPTYYFLTLDDTVILCMTTVRRGQTIAPRLLGRKVERARGSRVHTVSTSS